MNADRLWAPWRSGYVSGTAPHPEGCLFCAISAGGDDEADLVLMRGARVFVVMNRYPYVNGHLMVVPHRHAAWLSELDLAETTELVAALALCETALREGMRCAGMNGGWNVGRCAGAGVEGHIHLHILPRWNGDVNFMTPVAGARVISEDLGTTFARLRPFFVEGGA
jgi:ATP adenylyltransferase